MNKRITIACLLLPMVASGEGRDAAEIVRAAIEHWRGLSSYTEMRC